MTNNLDFRRKARQLAMQFLFQNDYEESFHSGSLDVFWENIGEFDPDLPIGKRFEKAKDLAVKFITSCIENKKIIDEKIENFAKDWRIERMAVVDRNIMRLAVAEMLFFEEIPPVVSINEAVELAKKYGSETSSAFINGILNSIKDTLQRPAREAIKKNTSKSDENI